MSQGNAWPFMAANPAPIEHQLPKVFYALMTTDQELIALGVDIYLVAGIALIESGVAEMDLGAGEEARLTRMVIQAASTTESLFDDQIEELRELGLDRFVVGFVSLPHLPAQCWQQLAHRQMETQS